MLLENDWTERGMALIPLKSHLEGQELALTEVQEALEGSGYTLGGNWDYDHGCFDYALDHEKKVWLRLPFEVTIGKLDSERDAQDTLIRFGSPYVLKHLYNDGLDPEADTMTYRGLIDQFQSPVDKDADLEPRWIDQAKTEVSKAEKLLLQESVV
jgi:hypothetical protein